MRVAIGADDEDKVELEPACFGRARHIVVDSRELTSRCGCLAHGFHARAVTAAAMTGELLDSPRERSNKEITISRHVGVGVEDLAAAHVVLTRLGDAAAASG